MDVQRALVLIALTLGCGSSSAAPAPAAAPAEAAAPAAESWAPRPFGADALRGAMTVGTEIRYRIEAAGKPTVIEHWTVTAADSDGCTIRSRTLSEDGAKVLGEQTGTSRWTELEQHASFPAELTSRTGSSIEVAAGKFDTWLYEVRPGKPGEPTKRLHFARTLPGPPVWMELTADGQAIMKMELVSRSSP